MSEGIATGPSAGLGSAGRDPARSPANGAVVVLIRAAISAMCARLDFTIDRIEDVKLAVDEAAALLLSDAPDGAELDVRFTPGRPGRHPGRDDRTHHTRPVPAARQLHVDRADRPRRRGGGHRLR